MDPEPAIIRFDERPAATLRTVWYTSQGRAVEWDQALDMAVKLLMNGPAIRGSLIMAA
jgi:hypothetical protein